MVNWIPSLLLLIAVGAQDASPEAAKRELARHQGVWRVERYEREGERTPDDVARSIVRKVEGDHVVWERDGKPFAGTTVALDPTADPPALDVLPDGGPARGKRVLGIYKLEGDRLTICMADPDAPRPRTFDAPKGSGRSLVTFRKERP